MSRRVGFIAVIGLLAGAAQAAPPPAQKPVDTDKIMGRWYEILRTPNKHQKNCFAAYQDWSHRGDAYEVRQVCHADRPDGRESATEVGARPLNPQNTEFEASFFGGIVRARYWFIDHDESYSWMIATTSDGHFPKLLARQSTLPAGEEEMLKRRMAALGFDVARMEAPTGAVAP